MEAKLKIVKKFILSFLTNEIYKWEMSHFDAEPKHTKITKNWISRKNKHID